MVAIRPATLADARIIAEVNVAVWRSAYRGIISDGFLDSRLSVDGKVEDWTQALRAGALGATLLAEDDGVAIGYASGGPGRGRTSADGELYAIYIRPEHHQLGLGRRLVAGVVRHLRDRGRTTLLVWVLAGNRPARRFYEALGGVVCDRQVLQFPTEAVAEVSYRWEDSALLLDQPWAASNDPAKSI